MLPILATLGPHLYNTLHRGKNYSSTCATCNRTLLTCTTDFNKLEVSRLDSTLSVFVVIIFVQHILCQTIDNRM